MKPFTSFSPVSMITNMKFENELISGKLIKRYKRFLTDVELDDGSLVTAHTANTGSMKTAIAPGWSVMLSKSDNPKRKLAYTLELTHNGENWIGVNTSVPNKLAYNAVEEGLIEELRGHDELKREVKIGKSRIDLMARYGEKKCYIEVKNVSMKVQGENVASFPDSVSTRALKHLHELQGIVQSGGRACMIYIIQREDVDSFTPAYDIDPEYSHEVLKAKRAGVELFALQYSPGPSGIFFKRQLPIILREDL